MLCRTVLLAVVQGVTEFLPISSSGHLALLQHTGGPVAAPLLVPIVLHAGTLASILVYYAADLWELRRSCHWAMVGKIALGTAPIVLVGLLCQRWIEAAFSSPWLAAAGLMGTAAVLLLLHRCRGDGQPLEELSWRQALAIGCMQCVAILPGVSRSGSTIAAATRLGLDAQAAARFSFYLAIPAISGATILETFRLWPRGAPSQDSIGVSALVLGFAVATVVGYVSLALLIRVLRRGKLRYFGYYCFVLGSAVLLLLWCRR